MVERREGTSTEGKGLGHSWADDNVERGADGVDFIKRRPTYPLGDDPRGRELQYQDESPSQSYASKNSVYRAYRDKAPLEGQDFGMPERVGALDKLKDLRPELPDRAVDTVALDAAKELEREQLKATDFGALFPSVFIQTPAGGATYSPGAQLTVTAPTTSLRSLTSATLYVGNRAVARRTIDRRDQDATQAFTFIFIYNIPIDQPLGPLDITVRAFNFATASQGFIADDAVNNPPLADDIQTGKGSDNNEFKHQATSSLEYSPQLEATGILRTPEGVSSITINIV